MSTSFVNWLSDVLGGAPVGGELCGDATFAGFEIDSRRVMPGHCFVALPGAQVDGHDYLPQAAAAGAMAAIVSRQQSVDLPQWVVESPERSMQQAAAAWRQRFDPPLVGITGSNGKTTTRALTASVLTRLGPVCATTGNLNNHLGLPMVLSRLDATHRSAVIEMGANHVGDIAQLASWARPTIGIITQAGDAHLEGFGSRDAIARGKGELIEALPADGIAILNADDAYLLLWTEMAGRRRIVRFGLGAQADVRAVDIQQQPESLEFTLLMPGASVRVSVAMIGQHNLYNALAAAAAGMALGLSAADIAEGLAAARGESGRLRIVETADGVRIADDSYNANPGSMRAGLDWLATQPPPRWAVLGAMAELGAASDVAHRNVGAHAAQRGIERLVVVGETARSMAQGFGPTAEWFSDRDEAIAALRSAPLGGVTVLIKGSRSAGMERVVHALVQDRASQGEASCSTN